MTLNEKTLWDPAPVCLQVHGCMIWSGTMQTKFTSLLPPTATFHSQPKKCSGGCSSAEEQWHLVPGASAGSARQLQGTLHIWPPRASPPPPLPQESSPRDILRAFTTSSRCKDPQESGAAKARQLTEKQVLERSNLQPPIFQQCTDSWITYL